MRLTNTIRQHIIRAAFLSPEKSLANDLAPIKEEIDELLKAKCPKDFLDFVEKYPKHARHVDVTVYYQDIHLRIGYTKYTAPLIASGHDELPSSVNLWDVLSEQELAPFIQKLREVQDRYRRYYQEFNEFRNYVHFSKTDLALIDRYPMVKPHLDEIRRLTSRKIR